MPIDYVPVVQVVQKVADIKKSATKNTAEILKNLQDRMPNTAFKSIEPTPVKGLYAVKTAGGKTFYTDESGRYFIAGIVFDTLTGKALNGALDGVTTGEPVIPQSDFDD